MAPMRAVWGVWSVTLTISAVLAAWAFTSAGENVIWPFKVPETDEMTLPVSRSAVVPMPIVCPAANPVVFATVMVVAPAEAAALTLVSGYWAMDDAAVSERCSNVAPSIGKFVKPTGSPVLESVKGVELKVVGRILFPR